LQTYQLPLPCRCLATRPVRRPLRETWEWRRLMLISGCVMLNQRRLLKEALPKARQGATRSTGDDTKRAWVDVTEWAADQGTTGLESVDLQSSGEAGLGMCAERDCQQGDSIVGVPLHACLRAHPNATNHVPPQDVWGDEAASGFSLAWTLLHEWMLGDQSPYAPYLASLQPTCVPQEHPILWASSKGPGSSLTSSIMRIATNLAQVSPALEWYLQNAVKQGMWVEKEWSKEELLGSPGRDKARLALAIVSSRTMVVDIDEDDQKVLCPVLDMLNHWTGQLTPHEPTSQPCRFKMVDDMLTMYAARDIRCGEELKFCYRPYMNIELFCYYGFTVKANAFEAVDILLSPDILQESLLLTPAGFRRELCSMELLEARRAALSTHVWPESDSPCYFRLPAEGGIAGQILPTFRLLALQTPDAVMSCSDNIFWMNSAGLPPADASFELEHCARTAEKAWLEVVLTSYDRALAQIDSLLGEGGRYAEDAPPRLLTSLNTLLQTERRLLEVEHEKVDRFCAAADRVWQLRQHGDEEKAGVEEQRLRKRFWSYESGWMGEWSGWTGERQEVCLGGCR